MKSKFHDKTAKDKGFAKWENEKPRVQAGVDVIDRGTEFEPDQDEGQSETRQDGEVSAAQTTDKFQRRRLKLLRWAV
jgi:RAS guanyl-releasing protein 3